MIAFTGELMLKGDKSLAFDADRIDIKPRERTDDVDVNWN